MTFTCFLFSHKNTLQDRPFRIPPVGSKCHPNGSGFVPVRHNFWCRDCPMGCALSLAKRNLAAELFPSRSSSSHVRLCREAAIKKYLKLPKILIGRRNGLEYAIELWLFWKLATWQRKMNFHKVTVISQTTIPASTNHSSYSIIEAQSLQWPPLLNAPSLLDLLLRLRKQRS